MSKPQGASPNRRTFLKGLLGAGLMSATPSLLVPRPAMAAPFNANDFQVFRNACPRNCYDTCSIKTYVKDGIVQFVEGAPESSFTKGALCVKGYTYPRRQYSPDRILYPMVQDGRRSGKWRRVSWEEAMDRIAKKILEIKKRDGSLLGLGLTKYSGHFGITNYGVEGMMSSLGYTTRFAGTPCWPAGIDAQGYDFGDIWTNDPEDMAKSKYIIVWGANPAWCSMHSVKFLYEARKRGAKVVVIDPILTQTAAKADEFLQIKAGTDGALALGMARHLLDLGLVDNDFVQNHAVGYEEFAAYLRANVTVEWAAELTSIPAERIRAIAEEFAAVSPATVWIGYGMQRHSNGGAMVRAIDALVAMSGNIGIEGGGARYAHLSTWGFNYHAMVQQQPEGSVGSVGATGPKGEFDFAGASTAQYSDRALNINQTARDILNATDPELRMLWVSCRNPFGQDADVNQLRKAFDKLEMVVTVEQFFTETVANSDIVLPATTLFEEWNVNVSYWHYWMSINQQAVKPMGEARSNIEIAAALSRAMNSLEAGSCTFAQEVDNKDWTIKEFNKGIYDLFGLKSWEDLLNGPAKAKPSVPWAEKVFRTPSQKFEFKSDACAGNGLNALPVYVEGRKASAPFRLMTPHVQFALHSQFVNLDWMKPFYNEPFIYMNPEAAEERGIKDMDKVHVKNELGEMTIRVKLTTNVSKDCVVMYEAWFGNKEHADYNVQKLVDDYPADMGTVKTGTPGIAFHDQFVDVQVAR